MIEFRVAVVGTGPAGMYAADALTDGSFEDVSVDLFERLPVPFGLLRYGVAPDHLSMKRLTPVLQRILDREDVRFAGDVEIGRDVTVDQLRAEYDAVVYACGAPADRPIDLPKADLEGVIGAGSFVSWYSGHPDAGPPPRMEAARAAAVVGAGNVALDVARLLLKPAKDLQTTDIPEAALEALGRTDIRDVYLLARRGPAEAKFTPNELREMGRIAGVDIHLDPADLQLADTGAHGAADDPRVVKNLEIFQDFAARERSEAAKRVHFLFNASPVAFTGEQCLTGVTVSRGGQQETLQVDMAVTAIGFGGRPIPGVPLDDARGVVPSTPESRVLRDGAVSPGEYVTGWARRGSTGVLGTNRADGLLVAAAIKEDLAALDRVVRGSRREDLADFARGKAIWAAIDQAEIELGEQSGRARTKIETWGKLRHAGKAAASMEPELSHAAG